LLTRIFVSDFEDHITEEDLARLFAKYGPVLRVSMREAKQRRYALITMIEGDADRAIEALSGEEMAHDLAGCE
jgi:RNA recognition motif-containing protein